jgi:hypothetical protein
MHEKTMSLVSSQVVFRFVSPIISGACMKISTINGNMGWETFMKLAGSVITESINGTSEELLYSSIVYKV